MFGRYNAVARGLAFAVAASALTACIAVDQYSYRAVGYNLEAEEALDQGLLLNIVRAIYYRPMQFTSVQTISGTASESGSASLTAPVGPHSNLMYKTAMFSGTVSGGPTFTVPVLDTQEFYQGVMSPVPSQLFDFFIHEEFWREEIFTLFVEKIVVTRDVPECMAPTGARAHTLGCELVFVNSPSSDLPFNLFQSLIDYLIDLGLITEPVATAKDAAQKTATGCQGNTPSGAAPQAGGAAPAASPSQPCQTPPAEYRFCFAPKTMEAKRYLGSEGICVSSARDRAASKDQGEPTTKGKMTSTTVTTTEKKDKDGKVTETTTTTTQVPQAPAGQIGKKTTVAGVTLSADFVSRLTKVADYTHETFPAASDADYHAFRHYLQAFSGQRIFFTVYTRSTEGVLFFLGEVARRQVNTPEGTIPRILQIKTEKSSVRWFDPRPCEMVAVPNNEYFKCRNLFVLETGLPVEPSTLSVFYGGQRYAVPADPVRAGDTMHVLSFVKQLMAVNTSAKSLPQTNVISVISP